MEANDNVRLWVAGRQLLNVFDNSGRRTTEASIELTVDKAEDIVIEFRERTGDADRSPCRWRSNSREVKWFPPARCSGCHPLPRRKQAFTRAKSR